MNWKKEINSIPKQTKSGTDKITPFEWNSIISILSRQANNNTLGILEVVDVLLPIIKKDIKGIEEFINILNSEVIKEITKEDTTTTVTTLQRIENTIGIKVDVKMNQSDDNLITLDNGLKVSKESLITLIHTEAFENTSDTDTIDISVDPITHTLSAVLIVRPGEDNLLKKNNEGTYVSKSELLSLVDISIGEKIALDEVTVDRDVNNKIRAVALKGSEETITADSIIEALIIDFLDDDE